jgi:hypothetical protein
LDSRLKNHPVVSDVSEATSASVIKDAQTISETLKTNSMLIRLVARKDFSAFSGDDSFKSFIATA